MVIWRPIYLIIIVLAIFTVVALLQTPTDNNAGKIQLSWLSAKLPVRDQQAEMFNRLNPDCHVAIDPTNTGMTKIVVQCTANMGGDLIDNINEDNAQTLYNADILWDVSEQAKKMGFGLDTIPEALRACVTVTDFDAQGKPIIRQVAYPMNTYHAFIIYNKNIFDRLGIPYPPEDLTWDEYIALAKKLTSYSNPGDDVPEIFGGIGVDFLTILWQKGGDVFNTDGTRCTLNSPEAIAAMQFYHDLIYKHRVEPTQALRSGVTCHADGIVNYPNLTWFGSGKLAMTWGARWFLMMLRPYTEGQERLKQEWQKKNPGKPFPGGEIRYGTCQIPRFKDGPRFVRAGGRSVGINRNSKNREAALKFLAFAAGPEYNRSIAEIADSKPPNRKYYQAELFYNPKYPDEKPVHDMSLKAVPYGRVAARSYYIEQSMVNRIIGKTLNKVSNGPDLTPEQIAAICRNAADEVDLIISRNIQRDNKLNRIYQLQLKQGIIPIRYEQLKP